MGEWSSEAAAMLRNSGWSIAAIGRALNNAGCGHPGQPLSKSRVHALLQQHDRRVAVLLRQQQEIEELCRPLLGHVLLEL